MRWFLRVTNYRVFWCVVFTVLAVSLVVTVRDWFRTREGRGSAVFWLYVVTLLCCAVIMLGAVVFAVVRALMSD